MTHWRFVDAAREGLARFRSGRFATAVLLAMTVLGLAASAVADIHQVSEIASRERAWEAAGGRVLIATNRAEDGPGGVPALACERLNGVSGVIAAGSVGQGTLRVRSTAAPGGSVRIYGVSTGALGLMGVQATPTPRLVAAPDVAQSLGVPSGGRVVLEPDETGTDQGAEEGDGPVLLDLPVPQGVQSVAVVPDRKISRLGEEYLAALLVPTRIGGIASACLVEASPGTEAAVADVMTSALADPNGKPGLTVENRIPTDEFSVDFVGEYDRRATRYLPWMFGALLGLVAAMIRWTQRSDQGLYALLGASAFNRLTMATASWAAQVLVAVPIAAAITVWVAASDSTRPTTSMVLGLGGQAMLLMLGLYLCFVLILGVLPVKSPLSNLRDR